MEQIDVAIIGGGAAGFFCACQLKELNPKLNIVICEKTNKILSKVLISGGGRCNITHNKSQNSDLIKNYPRGKNFLKKTFQHFSVQNTIDYFENKCVTLKTEGDGRMFPVSDDSNDVVNCLIENSIKHGVVLKQNMALLELKTTENNHYVLRFANETTITANAVVLASGGLQKMAHLSYLFEHKITLVPPYPSLFTFNGGDKKLHELMGVSAQNASVKIVGQKSYYEGPVLITHWGVSGPAILKCSAFEAKTLELQNYNFTVLINWINMSEDAFKNKILELAKVSPQKKISNCNPFNIPERLWLYLLEISEIEPDKICINLSKNNTNKLMENMLRFALNCNGKTTFKEEFVTAGGISTEELDANTCELKKLPNVFAIGEMVDVDGVTGGFNFQAAWSMAYAAAKAISIKIH